LNLDIRRNGLISPQILSTFSIRRQFPNQAGHGRRHRPWTFDPGQTRLSFTRPFGIRSNGGDVRPRDWIA